MTKAATIANRKSTSAAADRKKAAGKRQATFWLTPEAADRLEKLAKQRGISKEAVINMAVLRLSYGPMRYGQRVIWRSRIKAGVERRGVVRNPIGKPDHIDIKFDDASDDAPDWRWEMECEPE